MSVTLEQKIKAAIQVLSSKGNIDGDDAEQAAVVLLRDGMPCTKFFRIIDGKALFVAASEVLLKEYDLLKTMDVRQIMLDIVPGPDGQGHEVYATSVADVEEALTKLYDRIDVLEGT